jgi:hypothetical protein
LQVLKATGYPSHDLRSQHETAIIGDPQDSYWLVATWILFFHILGKIIQSDFHIFQRGRSTTNQVKVRSNSKSSRCLMFYFSAFSGDRSSVFFPLRSFHGGFIKSVNLEMGEPTKVGPSPQALAVHFWDLSHDITT